MPACKTQVLLHLICFFNPQHASYVLLLMYFLNFFTHAILFPFILSVLILCDVFTNEMSYLSKTDSLLATEDIGFKRAIGSFSIFYNHIFALVCRKVGEEDAEKA